MGRQYPTIELTSLTNGGAVTGVGTATFSVSAGSGIIADHALGDDYSTGTRVDFSSVAGVAPLYPIGVIYVDSSGTILQTDISTTPLTDAFKKANIVLARIRVVGGTIIFIDNISSNSQLIGSHLNDIASAIGVINKSGNLFSPNGANLFLNKSAGTSWSLGSNQDVSKNTPDSTIDAAVSPISAGVYYVYRNGSGGWTYAAYSAVTPDIYDNGSGTPATVSNNKHTIQRVYFVPGYNFIFIFLGQTEYNSQAEASAGVIEEPRVIDPSTEFASHRCSIVLKKGVTNLTVTSEAAFFAGPKFSGSSSTQLAFSTTTLQQAYDNSVTTELLTNSTNGALSIRRGSASDTDVVFEIQNGAGVVVSSFDSEGRITTRRQSIVPAVITTGVQTALSVVGSADTGRTASVEVPDLDFNLNRTVQWATGALLTQRFSVIRAPTIAFVGASVVTDTATLAITGAPIAGANATLTNPMSLWIQSGKSQFDGLIQTKASVTGSAGINIPHGIAPTSPLDGDVWTQTSGLFSRINGVNVGPYGIGTVTSIGIAVPAFLSVSGSPVTSSGTITVGLSGTALLVPNGGTGATTLTGILKGNGTSAFTAAVSGTDYVIPGSVTTSGLTMVTATILGRTTAATGAIEEITVGTGLTISAGVLSNANAGTVTSVGMSVPAFLSVAGSPITSSGTLAVTLSGTALPLLNGGTGSTAFTNGSVIFSNGSILTQDNANFFWDDANNRLGIGTNAPSHAMHVLGALRSNSHIIGTSPDLSLLSVVGGQSVMSAWWGLQLVGNRQATVEYTPANIGGSGDFSVIIPNQQAGSIGLIVRGQTAQTANLIELRNVGNTGLSAFNASGKLSLGLTAPTALLHLAAGTTAATTAPLKFTAGTNMTAAEAGAVEWDGTNLFITQTTGPTRKTVAYNDIFTSSVNGLTPASGGGTINFLRADGTWTNPVTGYIAGTIAVDQVAFGSGVNTVNGNNAFTYTLSNGLLSGQVTITPPASTGSPVRALTVNSAAHTALTASTEFVSFLYQGATQQFSTGAVATQRFALINAPTYAFVDASVITTASTFTISGAPIAGTNATITNPFAFWIQSGKSRIQEQLQIATGNPTISEPGSTLATARDTDGYVFVVESPNMTGTPAFSVQNVPLSTDLNTGKCFQFKVTGEANGRGMFYSDGKYTVGNGTAARDTVLSRSGVSIFRISSDGATGIGGGGLEIMGRISIGGALISGVQESITQAVATTGSPTALRVTGGAHTTLSATVEAVDFDFAANRTVEWSTGALSVQRCAVFRAPTYGFVTASTIATAATVAITGAPIAGVNSTITNSFAFWVQSGVTRFDGSADFNHTTASNLVRIGVVASFLSASTSPFGTNGMRAQIISNANAIEGFALRNVSGGTTAEERFVVYGSASTTDYLAFSMPGDGNTASTLFGLARNTNAFLFTNGNKGLGIGTVASQNLTFGTNNVTRLTISVTDITSTLKIITPASVSGAASFNMPHGTAPSAPVNGDEWTTTLGKFVRINGVTTNATRLVTTLTDAANIAVDAATGDEFTVTLGGNRTIDAPTNPINGRMMLFRLRQDATGSRTITWNAAFAFTTGLPAPTLSTGANKIDYVGFVYDSTTAKWHCLSYVLGHN
jgi:hypothetical protein